MTAREVTAPATAAGAQVRRGGKMPATENSPSFESLQMHGVAPVQLEVDADAAAQHLSRAITYATISNQDRRDFDEGAFERFHEFLEETFPRVHATLKREILGAPRTFSLLYTWTGKDLTLPPVVLMAHQDVVPVVPGTEEQWEHGAFSGDVADGYVWGRGTLDNKISILAIMEAVEMHLKEGFQPTRSIYLVFGQDEEVMGTEGARQVVAELEKRGVKDVALVLDEGLPVATGLFPGISAPIALVATSEKGYVTLELKVEGAGGHSAMPPRHSNIGILAQAVTRLEANPFPYRITQAVRDQMRFLGPELPLNTHAMLADVAFGGSSTRKPEGSVGGAEYTSSPVAGYQSVADSEEQFTKYMLGGGQTTAMMHTTTAITMVSGGVKENVLAPSASAVVNFRILHGDTAESVTRRVRDIIGDDRVQVSTISISVDPPPVADPYGKEYKVIEKSIRQTWDLPGLLVSPYLSIGGDDAKWFAAKIAKNVYRFTPVRVESAADTARWHGVNERVLVRELPRTIVFFHQFIANTEEL